MNFGWIKQLKGFFFTAMVALALYAALALAVPLGQFSFRSWEAVLVRNRNAILWGPFYPNQRVSRNEVGDLAPYTKNAVLNPATWITDRYGFRNSLHEKCTKFPVFLSGDSFLAGTGLDQKDTIPDLLHALGGVCSFSTGGHPFLQDVIPDSRVIGLEPKIVLNFAIERGVMEFGHQDLAELVQRKGRRVTWVNRFPRTYDALSNLNIYWEKVRHFPFQSFKERHGIFPAVTRYFMRAKSIDRDIVAGTNAHEPRSTVLLNGFTNYNEISDAQIENVVGRLAGLSRFFASQGTRYVVILIPSKETICGIESDPNLKYDFLPRFYAKLKAAKVEYVDLFHPFAMRGCGLYILDDTHWNRHGARVAAETVLRDVFHIGAIETAK